MKVLFKNSLLAFTKEPTLYTGIFNVSPTRVNQIVRDGCYPTNDFFSDCDDYVLNVYALNYETVAQSNGTKLTYVDVFKRTEGKTSVANLYIPKFGISQHITYGFWLKWGATTQYAADDPFQNTIWKVVDNSNVEVGKTTWKLGRTDTVTGTLADAQVTVTFKPTKYTLSDGTWIFFELHIDFESTPSGGVQFRFSAFKQTYADVGIVTANHTLIYDNVALDAMTYYPAAGHNPQKDPTAE